MRFHRKVMATLRENKMVTHKKQYNKLKVKQGNYLPLSSSPYQLSVTSPTPSQQIPV